MDPFSVIDENPGIMNVREIIDTAFGDFEVSSTILTKPLIEVFTYPTRHDN